MSDLPISADELGGFCRRRRVSQLALIGSILQTNTSPTSDVDVIVQFADDATWSLLDIALMAEELASLLGRPVDIIEESAVRNPYMRESIRRTKRVVYAA